MRPYHILLAVRIIILYRLFLLFCVHRGLLFFLVLLSAISETSLTYSTRFVLFPFLHSTSLVSSYLFLSCWWCFEFMSRAIRYFHSPSPFPSQIRPVCISHIGGWRVRYKHHFFFLPFRFCSSGFRLPVVYSILSPYLFLIGSWVLARTRGVFPHSFLRPDLDPFSRP